MRRSLLPVFFCAAFAATSLWSADFWTADFKDWTEKDVAKLLSDSPWATEYAQQLPGRGGSGGDMPGGASGRGGGVPGGGGGGRGGGGGVPSGASIPSGGPPPMETFIITWRSATPIKMGLARAMSGAKAITPELQSYIDKKDPNYVITVSSMKRYFGQVTEDPEELLHFAQLEIKGREPLRPKSAEVHSDQASTTIFYTFSKTEPITLQDKEVDFEFQMERTPMPRPEGPAEPGARRRPERPGGAMKMKALDIKRRFHLKNMVYNGELDL